MSDRRPGRTGRTGTWLCPTDQDRARLLENSPLDRTARRISAAALGLAALCLLRGSNWWLLLLLAAFVANVETAEARMRSREIPEREAALAILINEVIVGAAAALTGGPRSPLLALIVLPAALSAIRFRVRVVWLAAGAAALTLLAATVAVDPDGSLSHPAGLVVALTVTVAVGAVTQALSGAELHHRHTAILDPLTGLLNRQGLDRRFHELAEQARQTGAPISLLVCDLDHFKAINDAHGHAAGDAVLRDAATVLRGQLRSFELIYRLGGDEFLVMLPGATEADARTLAQRLCEAAREVHPRHRPLTLSVGTSTRWGQDARFRALFDAADSALYEAKASGRDRVVSAPGPDRTTHERRPLERAHAV